MPDPTFAHLAEEAAAGLKADRELYLDVKEELTTHLEAKAEALARQGHDEAESADLARKAFGSPLDVAAELVEANRGRMRWRALFRLAFGAVIVPVAVLLALYLGYGRTARLSNMMDAFSGSTGRLPMPPGMPSVQQASRAPRTTLDELNINETQAMRVLRYWETHKSEPGSERLYAYFATFARPSNFTDAPRQPGETPEAARERAYAEAMRRGEEIDPNNAVYNALSAECFLQRGMMAKAQKVKEKDKPLTDDLKDRRYFELGIAELRRLERKPYMRSHQGDILRMRLNALPQPVFTEDYLRNIAVSSAVLFPHSSRLRNLARMVPGAARLLIAEGRHAEAEAIMDTWRPLAMQMADGQEPFLIHQLVASASAGVMVKEAPEVYEALGKPAKAKDARDTAARLTKMNADRKTSKANRNAAAEAQRLYGPRFASFLYPVFGGEGPSVEEMTPGRMHEHVLMEQLAVGVAMALLALVLLVALLESVLWHLKLRRAGAAPFLLMPPPKVLARALLLGVALPVAVYAIYSRLPIVGGREYGWASPMWPRFAAELLLLAVACMWLTARLLRPFLRQRCEDLGIAVPDQRQEIVLAWQTYGLSLAGVAAIVTSLALPESATLYMPDWIIFLRGGLALLGCVAFGFAARRATRLRGEIGLYEGTCARTLALVYALVILLLSFTVQPVLLAQEAHWLRRDTVGWGSMSPYGEAAFGFSCLETRAVQRYHDALVQALGTPTTEGR